MARRKVLKIRPVLVTLNILVLFIIVCFYTFRFIKYYRLQYSSDSSSSSILSEIVIDKQSYLDSSKGLVFDEEENIYRYKGSVTNNYVNYSGMLFRIISVDKDNNIKMISEDNLTIMYSGLENGYDSSFVNKWLNSSDSKYSGIFENTLYDVDKLLTSTSLCLDNVNDVNKITCDNSSSDNKFTLLSLYDYVNAGGKNSYLNNGNSYYLSTLNDSNNNYYVESSGEVSLNRSNTKLIGVRAVITVKGEVENISGNGTKDKPYTIEKHDISKLSDAYVGDYISFSNETFRIVGKDNNKVKVALDGVIKTNNKEVSIKYSSDSNSYSINTNIGKYLNTTYYKNLTNSKYIVTSDWYVNKLSLSNLDYSLVYNSKVNTYIGMLGLSDFYVQDVKNVFTLSKGIEDNNIINVINKNGSVYGDLITKEYNVRPAFYLSGDISITSGVGSELGPYQLNLESVE